MVRAARLARRLGAGLQGAFSAAARSAARFAAELAWAPSPAPPSRGADWFSPRERKARYAPPEMSATTINAARNPPRPEIPLGPLLGDVGWGGPGTGRRVVGNVVVRSGRIGLSMGSTLVCPTPCSRSRAAAAKPCCGPQPREANHRPRREPGTRRVRRRAP